MTKVEKLAVGIWCQHKKTASGFGTLMSLYITYNNANYHTIEMLPYVDQFLSNSEIVELFSLIHKMYTIIINNEHTPLSAYRA